MYLKEADSVTADFGKHIQDLQWEPICCGHGTQVRREMVKRHQLLKAALNSLRGILKVLGQTRLVQSPAYHEAFMSKLTPVLKDIMLSTENLIAVLF